MNMKKGIVTGALSFALCASAVFACSAGAGQAQAAEKNYLVVFKDEAKLPSGYADLVKKAGGQVENKLNKLGAVEVSSSNPNFLYEIRKSSIVSAAGTENVIYPEAPAVEADLPLDGADLYNSLQWDIKQVTNDGVSWNLPGGTGKSADGKDIVVGVIDTGIDYNHPDLKENYAYGKSFVPGYPDPMDENSHGTHVAGSIAKKRKNNGCWTRLKGSGLPCIRS